MLSSYSNCFLVIIVLSPNSVLIMSKVSALFLESFRYEFFVYRASQVSSLTDWYSKHSRAVTTELNNFLEKADDIEIKILIKKSVGERQPGWIQLAFKKKLQD